MGDRVQDVDKLADGECTCVAEATSRTVASGEKVSVGVGVCIDRVFDRDREYINVDVAVGWLDVTYHVSV